MKDFAALQDAFQRAILEGDERILDDILDSPKETRAVLFGVYRDAYLLRLVEVMGNENAALAAQLGEEKFEEMARAYVAAHPSRHANLRWLCQRLPDFLARTEPYTAEPVLTELAALEQALADAFDAPDAPALAVTDLAGIPPDSWAGLIFLPQPHARRLDLATNAFAIWSAVSDEETIPEARALAEPERLIVWRQDFLPQVRAMSVEEAMLWDEASAGIPFGVLCEMAATYADPDASAARVAAHLSGWIAGGLLAGVKQPGRRSSRRNSASKKSAASTAR